MAAYYLSKDKQAELAQIAQSIATPGKGILAADEPAGLLDILFLITKLKKILFSGTIQSRFSPMNIENNEENRRYYRQLLFRTKECTQYISGIILCHETFYHKTDDDNTPFPLLLTQAGIIPGITVDRGLIVLGGTDNETTTQGLLISKKKIFDKYEIRKFRFGWS
jgi:fructose-bisphosphate aldolase class I